MPTSFHRPRSTRGCLLASVLFSVAVAAATLGAEPADAPLQFPLAPGEAHGFPELRDLQGHRLADAEFTQIPEGDRLRVRLAYDFGGGHRVEEATVVQIRPALVQQEWSWTETRGAETVRRFSVDFATGIATGEKQQNGQPKHWSNTVKIVPGRTFAGFAFSLALECLRDRVEHGEAVKLHAVAFTPEPRVVPVELTFAERDRLGMGGRNVTGDRFIIHPDIPAIAQWFVNAPDTRIWLIHDEPHDFLRWEGPLSEPDDPIVRVDVLPGDPSAPAEPVAGQAR